MKKIVVICLAFSILCGCNAMNATKKDPASAADPESETSSPGSKTAGESGNGGDNVQVLTGGAGAGGATPVVGGDNLGGGGGGTGMAAKDAARGAAAKAAGGTGGAQSGEE